MKPIEPFGYFRAEPFGWTACKETDDGAVPLYDQAAIDGPVKQRDDLLRALEKVLPAVAECERVYRQIGAVVAHGEIARALAESRELIASVKGGA